MKLLKLLPLLLILIPTVQAISVKDVSQSFSFNWLFLFLVIFFGCWIILQDVFKSSIGSALIVSIVIAIIGSFFITQQYGPIVPKLDAWFFVLIGALILFVIRSSFRGGKDPAILIIAIALPIIWFGFLQDSVSYLISSGAMNVISTALGIVLALAIFILVLSLLTPGKGQGRVEMRPVFMGQ